MPSQPDVAAATSRIPIDIRRLPWNKPLVVDYAFEYHRLESFFNGNPADAKAWPAAIERCRAYQRDRHAIVEIVHAQQQHRGAPQESYAAASRLREPGTVAVVTGQQAGLFGGPLFCLLKALTAIRLAAHVEQQYQTPAVPVFWIDAEDHDWDEVKACGVLEAGGEYRVVSVGDPPGARNEPVARICLDGTVDGALADLETVLPETEFRPALVEALRGAYRRDAGMADAFGRWLETVLGPLGLVVYDSSDRRSKPIVAGLFADEVRGAGRTSRLAAEAGARLEAAGYTAQVTPQPGTLALFDLDGGRRLIRLRDQEPNRFDTCHGPTTTAALMERVRSAPADFSPNVLLRPIVQDTLFPTVCYVAGPNELAYLGQLRTIYEAFEVPMPLIYQRATATLLDAGGARFLSRHDVPFESLRAQDDSALNRLLEAQLPPGVDASLREVSRLVEEHMRALAGSVTQVDPTLEGAVRSSLGRINDDLKKLHSKIVQAEKRKDETLRRQFRHLKVQAFPEGDPQERAVGFVYFLNKYGPTLVQKLADELPLDMGTHWVLIL